ncbi:MAG: DNA-processing protein DprA [Bacteroidia bacterium]|nr:DNA-processing protein DprA [Bacteroidia bacterium]
MNEEILALLALLRMEGIGAKHTLLLRRRWGTLSQWWDRVRQPSERTSLPEPLQKASSQIDLARKEAEALYLRCDRLGIRILPFWEASFPSLLQEVSPPPVVLYHKGNLEVINKPSVAVVGTRKPTSYGLRATEYFVEALVDAGLVIVSGLAYGIDACAHRITVEKGGSTLAVLAHGLNRIYPPGHRKLADAILENGAWLSEYPPDTPIHPTHFPFRNRIIAGLSHITLVIESQEKGGALYTAQAAFQANRPVFAVPGEIFSPTSQGTHRLIAEHIAQIATDASALLSELHFQKDRLPLPPQGVSSPEPEDPLEKAIYTFLSDSPRHVDEIALHLGRPVGEVTQQLLVMEVAGWIIQQPGGLIKRASPRGATP